MILSNTKSDNDEEIGINKEIIASVVSDSQISLADGSTISVNDYVNNLLSQSVGFETEEEYQEYILDKFTSYLDEMKSTYQAQEENDGFISNLYDDAKKLFGLGTSSDDVNDSINQFETMVQGLTDAINGNSEMSFEQAYEYYTGTSFSTEKIDKYIETSNIYSAVMVGCQYDEDYQKNFEKTTGTSVNEVMQNYAQCQLDTFGEVSEVKNIIDEYIQDQQSYADKLSSIISTTGLACTVAGAVTTFFCPPAGIALMQAGKSIALSGMFIDNAIELVDNATDNDGLTKDEIKDLALETGVETVSYAAGRSIGKLTNGLNSIVSSKVAQTGANNITSYIAGQAAETVVDTGLSLGADYAIAQGQSLIVTGELMDSEDYWSLDRFLGEGKNQLIGILTGLSSAKVNAYQQGVIKTAQEMVLDGDTDGAKTYLTDSGMKLDDTSFEGFVKNVQEVSSQVKLQANEDIETDDIDTKSVEPIEVETQKSVEIENKEAVDSTEQKSIETAEIETQKPVDYSKMTYEEKAKLLEDKGVDLFDIKNLAILEETQFENALKLAQAGVYSFAIKDLATLEETQFENALKLAQAGVDSFAIKYLATLEETQFNNALKLAQAGVDGSQIKNLATTLADTQIDSYIYFKNLSTNNGDKIFTKESNISYMLNIDTSSVDASNFEMLINLVQDGVVGKHVIKYLPILGKLNPTVVSDIDKLYEAYTLGIEPADAIVPTFKNVAEALDGGNDSISFNGTYKEIKTGDVFQVEGEDFIRIKTSDTESKQLNISKETYLKLFPPIERYATTQNQIGNCWELTGINSLLCEPDTRASVLELFSQDGNDIVIKFPNSQYAGTVFENGELPTTADKRYYSRGVLGVQMLEYADGVEIQKEKIDCVYNALRKKIESTTDVNLQVKYANSLVNFTILLETYNENVKIDIKNGSIQWEQYKGKYDSVISENRNGGLSSNLYKRVGYKGAEYIKFADEDGFAEAKDLLKDSKSFDDYVISFATGGNGIEKTLNSTLGIVSKHAYRIKPATVDSNGEIKTFKLINPWGILETELTYEQVLDYGQGLFIAKKIRGNNNVRSKFEFQ